MQVLVLHEIQSLYYLYLQMSLNTVPHDEVYFCRLPYDVRRSIHMHDSY